MKSSIYSLALRNLGRRRRRTALTALGVALGVAMIVLLTAMFDGFLVFILHQSVETDIGALQVHDKRYLDAEEPLRMSVGVIEGVEGVTAISPRIRFDGMINNGREASAIWLFAYDPDSEYAVCPGRLEIESVSLKGAPENAILLGESLADSLGLKLGDEATLLATTSTGKSNALNVTVSGFITSRVPLQVKTIGVVQLPFAQKLLDMQARHTEVAFAVKDTDRIDAIAAALRKKLGEVYTVSTWRDLDPVGTTAINQTRVIIGILILMLYALAAIGIANTMTLSVHERVREIGTMLAIGMRRADILRLFVIEAAALAITAAFTGLVLGTVASLLIAIPGIAFEVPDSPPLVIRPDVRLDSLAVAAAIIIVATIIAAFYPAARASRLAPVEALANR